MGCLQQGTFLYQRDDHPPDYESSGHPPASCLLARRAYIDKRTNATTAYCQAKDLIGEDVTIQVTFVVANPPRVSYFCAYCTRFDFDFNPIIVRTEGRLALLYLCVSTHDFYVYQADGGSDGKPSLTLLPHPRGRHLAQFGPIGFLPRQRPSRHYRVAALLPAPESASGHLQFELYIYNSKKRSWKITAPVLQQHQVIPSDHNTCKVITIGGDRGTMGFVDPNCGIVFCDVMKDGGHLYYVPLPEPLHPTRLTRHDAWRVCDVAVDTKRSNIRFVELDDTATDGSGWQAVVWSTPIEFLWLQAEERWRLNGQVRSSQLVSSNLVELQHMVSDLNGDQQRKNMPFTDLNLDSVYIELPTLSLHDDCTVYFLTQESIRHRDAWVISVDMTKPMLQTVAQYCPGRGAKMFQHSSISNHPCMTPGTIRNLKRPGTQMPEPSCKKQSGFFRMNGMVSSWVAEEEQHYGTNIGAEDEDNMDVDM